jgi:hypothetical protein
MTKCRLEMEQDRAEEVEGVWEQDAVQDREKVVGEWAEINQDRLVIVSVRPVAILSSMNKVFPAIRLPALNAVQK